MGRYFYTWDCTFYGSGGFVKTVYIEAKNKAEALQKLHQQERVIEMICCKRAYRW